MEDKLKRDKSSSWEELLKQHPEGGAKAGHQLAKIVVPLLALTADKRGKLHSPAAHMEEQIEQWAAQRVASRRRSQQGADLRTCCAPGFERQNGR